MPEKPENFFQPGKPSHCIFSPDLDCDVYQPFSLFAPADFLCKVVPLTVGVILPAPEGDAGKIWDEIYERIAKVWQDRQVGFSCLRCEPEAWAQVKPCDTCALAREAQVVIFDLDRGNLRAESFRDMANASATTLQVIKASNPLELIPGKLVILISCGPTNLPPHVQRSFHCIDYADKNGEPDLDLLTREMEAIAHDAGLFQEGDVLSLDLSDLDAPAVSAAASPAEPEPEDLIRFLSDAEPVSSVPPARTERDPLAEARRLMQSRSYDAALRVLQGAGEVAPADRESWRALASTCLGHLSSREIVDTFYGAARDRGRLSLSAWTAAGDLPSAILRVDDSSLRNQLGASEVPLYACDRLAPATVDGIRDALAADAKGPRTAIVVARECEEAAGRRLLEAHRAPPSLRLIEVRLADVEAQILSRGTAVDFLKERTRMGYRRETDPFLEGIHRIVCGEGEFFGRAELRSKLAGHVRSGESFVVYGLPRAGKSSLLRQLMLDCDRAQDLPVLVDLQAHPPRQVSDLYRLIVQSVRQALANPEPEVDFERLKLFSLDATAPASKWRVSFVEDLMELASRLQGAGGPGAARILLLFDEIDCILPDKVIHSPGIDLYREILEQLDLLSAQGRFVIGLGGFGAALKHEMNEGDCPLYERVHQVPLGTLTAEEGSLMIRSLGRRTYNYYRDDGISALLQASGRDPLLTKYLGSAALETCGAGAGLIDEAIAARGIEIFLRSPNLRRRLARAYGMFAAYFPSEAHLLKLLALEQPPNGGAANLAAFQGRQFAESALKNLCDYGLIERIGQDQVSIRGGLFHEWLRQENLR